MTKGRSICNICAVLILLLSIIIGYGYLNLPLLYQWAVKRNFNQYKYGTLCLQYKDNNNIIEKFGINSHPDSICDATMLINNSSQFFSTLATAGGSIGLGEAYFNSVWDTNTSEDVDTLSTVLYHILWNQFHLETAGTLIAYVKFTVNSLFEYKVFLHWLERLFIESKTLENDLLDIEYHYDKGYTFDYDITTEFWESYLGSTRTGSCAIWDKNTRTLEDAQNNKWDIIINKLDILPNDTVLDVGSGWGYACSKINNDTHARCIGITLSKDQLDASEASWHSQLCKVRSESEVAKYGCIEFKFLDYRMVMDEFGSNFFSKIVSVGMVEHVGYQQIGKYFEVLSGVLDYDGKMLIHGITMDDLYPNFKPVNRRTVCTNANFIGKYIFPGGCILHPDIMVEAAMDSKLEILHRENYGKHYARTLNVWLQNQRRNWDTLSNRGNLDTRFFKLNEFYLAMCEALFRTSRVELSHFLFIKPKNNNGRDYDASFYLYDKIVNPNVPARKLEKAERLLEEARKKGK